MGKFDGILLCSDWDGTLCDGGPLLQNNVEAIRYFQKNGGKFTLASGRYAGHFKQFSKDILPNTDLVCVGGSCVMSLDGEILYENDKTISELSDAMSADLKKRGMKFVGSTIIYSYLQAAGVINSHEEGCFLYKGTCGV